MIRNILSTAAAAAALSISLGAHAASVDITPGVSDVLPTSEVTLTVSGSGFDMDVDSGSFRAVWDPAVLQYVSITFINPAWDTTFPFEDNAASGSLDYVFLGASNNAGTDFTIAELRFNAIGGAGSSTTVQLSVDTFGTTWNINAVPYETVDYGSAVVNIVPIPAAAWLFGSALGLLGWVRRR